MLKSRAANAIFGKIGRIASAEVTLQLLKSKRLPVLLYGLEACPLTKADLHSLDFVINRFFMKLFVTKNIETVKQCQDYFGFSLPSVVWANRVAKSELNFESFISSPITFSPFLRADFFLSSAEAPVGPSAHPQSTLRCSKPPRGVCESY